MKFPRIVALLAWLSVIVGLGVIWAHALAANPAADKPAINVILITMDTLRADHVGCYGATQVQTPVLDSLSRDGVVFEHAYSQVPLTWPSHTAILTGTYPFQNGVQDFTGQPLSSRFRSVAQGFQAHGYATGAVVSSFVLDRSWGLARGFDFYDDAFSAGSFHKKDIGLVDRRAEESVSRTISWLAKNSQRPFFFWLHLYDPHSPYDPPEPFQSEFKNHLYDGEIAYADHELGRLISWLKQKKLYDRSLIIFLSDHGESLGDHGENEHGFFIYNSTMQVPLIVKPPAGSGIHPGRVSTPVETIAVAPTLLRLAGVKDTIDKQFQSPALPQKNADEGDGAYGETFYPFSSFGWSPLHSLETSRYHYIDAPQPELYDVVNDPEEKNNLAAQQSATVAVFKDKLQQRLKNNPFARDEPKGVGLNPETAEKLRALGYVAYRTPVPGAALAAGLPDPKAKVGDFESILRAQDALRAGDFRTGESVLAAVSERNPQMYVLHFMLGEAFARQQKWQDASAQFDQALQLNPNFDQAMTGLAQARMMLNEYPEARRWLTQALKFNPQNYRAWYELGTIEAKTDKAAAIADYEEGVAIQPNFAPLRQELGTLQLEQRKYHDAQGNLEKAAELGAQDAAIFNYLGICYSRQKLTAKGIASYRRAIELDPNLAEAHLNLAFAYQQLGRKPSADEEYARACQLKAKFCNYAPQN